MFRVSFQKTATTGSIRIANIDTTISGCLLTRTSSNAKALHTTKIRQNAEPRRQEGQHQIDRASDVRIEECPFDNSLNLIKDLPSRTKTDAEIAGRTYAISRSRLKTGSGSAPDSIQTAPVQKSHPNISESLGPPPHRESSGVDDLGGYDEGRPMLNDHLEKTETLSPAERLLAIEDFLGYSFKDRKWLAWSISKGQVIYEGKEIPNVQQYLAVIGDGLLKAAYYIHNFPYRRLSDVNRTFCQVSTNEALAKIMIDSGLLLLINPKVLTGYRADVLSTWDVATILEAIVGAVYIDSYKNYDSTKLVIENMMQKGGFGREGFSALDGPHYAARDNQSTSYYTATPKILYSALTKDRYGRLTGSLAKQKAQRRFIALRMRKASLLNQTVPSTRRLARAFDKILQDGIDHDEFLEIEETHLNKLESNVSSFGQEALDVGQYIGTNSEPSHNIIPKGQKLSYIRPESNEWPAQQLQEEFQENFAMRRSHIQNKLGYEFEDPDLLKMVTRHTWIEYKGRIIPNPQKYLGDMGSSFMRLAFYQHNFASGIHNEELNHSFIAIRTEANLAMIFEDSGLLRAFHPRARLSNFRHDVNLPTGPINDWAKILTAIFGAVWIDSGMNYTVTKAVVETILRQNTNKDEVDSPLYWQRVVERKNVHWPRSLRNGSPLREFFSSYYGFDQIDTESEAGKTASTNGTP